MPRICRMPYLLAFATTFVILFGIAPMEVPAAHAQVSISSGSIQGTILDPNGGVVNTAKVSITSKETGQVTTPEVTGTGDFNSGALHPGTYTVRIEAAGFKTIERTLTVQVGVVSSGSVNLEIGSSSTVITVEASGVQLNTEQATVQGVMTTDQIEQLPIGGRNFLDLAQLEPGVQIQDGGNFDPTKNGFSSISFGGRFGRTARIEVDGVDISDETVGTTTQNVPASAIQEFQVGQSSLDLSTELTSSGSVNVVTHSGSNDLHGEGFFYGRDDGYAARIAQSGPSVFTRHQYGANLGGAVIKNKLFFFGDFERGMQNLSSPVTQPAPFSSINGTFNSPFREWEFLGRLDWQISPNYRAFYRYTYEQNRSTKGFVPNTFDPFLNTDNTPSHVGGLDFTTGSFTHSIRAGYMKFRNGIGDAVLGSSIFNPGGKLAIAIGADPFCLTAGLDPFCSGANFLAPQKTFQSNKQLKYDGSKTLHSHIVRYGVGVNRINGGGFAAFIASAPIAGSGGGASKLIGNLQGGASNPLNYAVDTLVLGNGQGFATENPGFGFKAGRQADTRFQWYVGDSWKIKPNFTLTYGLHYARDTGRADSDLPAIPVLNQFGPGLGNRVNQPNKNFGPQVGIAWSPDKSRKTVIRAGGGLYYENSVWNNVLFDRPVRLQKGLFLGLAFVCPSGSLTLPGGTKVTQINGRAISQDCSSFIGDPNVVTDAVALQQQYQQATVTAGAQSNGSFIGNTMAAGQNSTGNILIAPGYRTPRSYQMNVGMQRELKPGTTLSVDYLRNIGLRFLLAYDVNHVGDARYLDTTAATNAINTTDSGLGCTTGTMSQQIDCAIGKGATIASYQGNGLNSGNAFSGGFPCSPACAFPGIHANLGQNQMLFPIGRSVYNGLDIKLTSNVKSPITGIKRLNYQVAYSLSRFASSAQDQDFINYAIDFRNTTKYNGPNGLDRKHQLSAGAVLDLPLATRISFVTHWYSALPRSVLLPGGSIFTSDLTGDGTGAGNTLGSQGSLLPGTNIGSFGRDFGVSGLTNLIATYNNTIAGKTLTPAGTALVNAGLFSQAQLLTLGATPQPIAAPPNGEVGLDHFFTFDVRLGWVLHANKAIHALPERVTIEPQIQFYNLFNRQNFDSPSQPLSGVLSGGVGTLNGTTRFNQAGCATDTTKCTGRTNLTSLGSGVFGLGAPRQMEWGIKVSF
ncbi:MAG TPA: carboxypeptidase regulatory-like domain-containing protein [Candidatus Acidoferrum sp.]|nr:carboxypeptidase regulatory-like domain-containing protein [Candidatus Acidoferrum sp.]